VTVACRYIISGGIRSADCSRTRLKRRLRARPIGWMFHGHAGLLRGTPPGNCSNTAASILGHDSDFDWDIAGTPLGHRPDNFRTFFEPLLGHRPVMAQTLSRLALDNRRPVLRTPRGLCTDTLLARTERGQGLFTAPDRSRPCPGDCRIKDADKPRSRTYAGRFAWTFHVPPRLIRGHKGLSGLRGWCRRLCP